MYNKEEKLELTNSVGITKDVDKILIKLKRQSGSKGQQVSKSKIVCNLVLEAHGRSTNL